MLLTILYLVRDATFHILCSHSQIWEWEKSWKPVLYAIRQLDDKRKWSDTPKWAQGKILKGRSGENQWTPKFTTNCTSFYSKKKVFVIEVVLFKKHHWNGLRRLIYQVRHKSHSLMAQRLKVHDWIGQSHDICDCIFQIVVMLITR